MKIQGIKKYYNKESYIVEVFKNKKIFKRILNNNIKDIHSEVRLNNNKIRVDLVCEVKDGSLAFTEISIRDNCIKDFVNHRRQLIEILNVIGKNYFAHIILMSPDFLNEDIKEIENLIASYNVKVYFLYIPMELISKTQNPINIDFSARCETIINKSNTFKCIKITSKTIDMSKKFMLYLNNEQCGNSISKAILKGLREKIYWHLPVHRYKNLRNNIIRIGTGTSDVILNIYCNTKDKIKIEIDFAQRFNLFNMFKHYMADMSNKIDNSIQISTNNPKIYTEIPILKSKKITIDTTIKTADLYIEYITKMYKTIHL